MFPKNTQIRNLTNIRPVGAELFYADGQTDMLKLIVAFETLQTYLKSSQNWERLKGALGSEENFRWG